jgi:hypothetical protein
LQSADNFRQYGVEASVTGDFSPAILRGREMADETRLRPEAVELLLTAISGKGDCEGVIALTKTSYGTSLSFGLEHKTLATDRDSARYQFAIGQLTGLGLLEPKTESVWHVTADGRAKADELQAFGQQSTEWGG